MIKNNITVSLIKRIKNLLTQTNFNFDYDDLISYKYINHNCHKFNSFIILFFV